jgi:hypothetical protein
MSLPTGAGTALDPWVLLTREHLEWIEWGDCSSADYFALGADISLAGSDWTPLLNGGFSGQLDGKHYKISGLTINKTGSTITKQGFFAYIEGGSVRDVSFCSAHVHVTTTDTANDIGILAGITSHADLDGVTVSGTIVLDGAGTVDNVGGLGGRLVSPSTVDDCYVALTIDKPEARVGDQYGAVLTMTSAGGICGQSDANTGTNTIADCSISLTVSNSDPTLWFGVNYLFDSVYVGGIVGWGTVATAVSGCRTTINMTCGGSYNSGTFGGFIAAATALFSLTDCHVSGTIVPTTIAGGMAGAGKYISCIRCGADVNMRGATLGGAIGDGNGTAAECVCTDCWAAGDVTGEDIGGFIGAGEGTFTRCYSTGHVDHSSWSYYGGFAGMNAPVPATTVDCYWDTQTSGVATSMAGTGKTTAEMQTQSTFTGWDFSTVWNIASGTYPFLRTAFVTVTNGCLKKIQSNAVWFQGL